MTKYIDAEKLIKRINTAEENFKFDHMETIDGNVEDPFVDGVLSGVFNIREMIAQAEPVKAIPLDRMEQIRAEMQELIDWHDCPIEYDNGNDYWYCQAVTQCIDKLDKAIKEVSK